MKSTADVCLARGTAHAHLRDGRNARVPHAPESADPCSTATRCGLGASCSRAQCATAGGGARFKWRIPRPSDLQLPQVRAGWMFSITCARRACPRIGTARLIFSLNYGDADFAAVADRVVAAAGRCGAKAGGGESGAHQQGDCRRVLRELLQAWWSVLHRIDQFPAVSAACPTVEL